MTEEENQSVEEEVLSQPAPYYPPPHRSEFARLEDVDGKNTQGMAACECGWAVIVQGLNWVDETRIPMPLMNTYANHRLAVAGAHIGGDDAQT